MHVTILADASHCPNTKAGGYGYWIASARGKKGGSGILKGFIVTSTLAEIMAIGNAIHHGIQSGLVQSGDILLIQTDCESAIFALTLKRKSSEEEKKVIAYVQKVMRLLCVTIEYRHVKGHSSRTEARFAANRKCDRSARKEMRKARVNFHLQAARELLENSRKKHETIS